MSRLAGGLCLLGGLLSVTVLGGVRNLADAYGIAMMLLLCVALGFLTHGAGEWLSGLSAISVLWRERSFNSDNSRDRRILKSVMIQVYGSSFFVGVVQFFQRPGGLDSRVLSFSVLIWAIVIVEFIIRPSISKLDRGPVVEGMTGKTWIVKVFEWLVLLVSAAICLMIILGRASGCVSTPDDQDAASAVTAEERTLP